MYYIFILHQTTTMDKALLEAFELYYIFILHQTTTKYFIWSLTCGCIISSFYIKPQPILRPPLCRMVVLYLHSTSNHNGGMLEYFMRRVVLYLHSTSNHNVWSVFDKYERVVLYLHSTSNHNDKIYHLCRFLLYYNFILHHTTTFKVIILLLLLLYYIFILHQTTTLYSYRK